MQCKERARGMVVAPSSNKGKDKAKQGLEGVQGKGRSDNLARVTMRTRQRGRAMQRGEQGREEAES